MGVMGQWTMMWQVVHLRSSATKRQSKKVSHTSGQEALRNSADIRETETARTDTQVRDVCLPACPTILSGSPVWPVHGPYPK